MLNLPTFVKSVTITLAKPARRVVIVYIKHHGGVTRG